jgi:hypothetical protein
LFDGSVHFPNQQPQTQATGRHFFERFEDKLLTGMGHEHILGKTKIRQRRFSGQTRQVRRKLTLHHMLNGFLADQHTAPL